MDVESDCANFFFLFFIHIYTYFVGTIDFSLLVSLVPHNPNMKHARIQWYC